MAMVPKRQFSFLSALKGGTQSGTMLDVNNSIKHCTDTVQKFDYYSWRVGTHFPKQKQPYYYALNAFFLEVLRSREISREQSICQTRLNWWKMSLDDVENDKTPREPIAKMLLEAKKNTHVNFKLLHRMVEFQLFDIDRGAIQTMKELEVFGENTRSLSLYLNLHILGVDSREANLAASHLGRCLGICDVLKKTPYYLAVQRRYLPAEILARHNCFFDRIVDKTGGDGNVADEFYDVVLEVAAYAKKHLEEARRIAAETPLPEHAHRALLLAQECDHFLDELEQSNFNVFEPRFRRISKIHIPRKIYSAAKNNRF